MNHIAGLIPGGGCVAIGHAPFQEAMLANAVNEGATVLRGVSAVDVSSGPNPQVSYEHSGKTATARCRLVIGADGRHSQVRKGIGLELASTDPQFMMAGMLVDNTRGWPSHRQSTGVYGDFHFLIFPQAENRVRVYGGWDVNDAHRFTGKGREQRFLEQFRMDCLPNADAIADGTPAGTLAAYPMTDTWTEVAADDGVVLVGDAAGWSDPVIGQGMAVTFRDVHMAADIIRDGADWSASAFGSYAEERRERMRRLRFVSAAGYLRHGLGTAATAKRQRLHQAFVLNPMINPAATALLGTWVMPESSYTDEAWAALVAI